jgi:hypothetical protein
MKKRSEQLQRFIGMARDSVVDERRLNPSNRKLFRALKSAGERAIKGQEIDRCVYEVRFRSGLPALEMLVEGRNAKMVGRQVARRFEEHREFGFVDVVETKNGVKVVLRPIQEEESNA